LDEKKATEKKEEEEKEEEEGVSTKPLIKLPGSDRKERDYSIFPADVAVHMKGTSNEAFNYISELVKEKKQLEGLKDASYLQHEQAYILNPEFQKINEDVFFLSSEAKLLQQALVNMESGAEFQIPQQVDGKTGQWVMSQPIKPTADWKVNVQQALAKLQMQTEQRQGQLEQLQTNYVGRVKQSDAEINKVRSGMFEWVEDPKKLDTQIDIDGKPTSIKSMRDGIINRLPVWHRGSVLAQIIGDLWVCFHIARNQSAKKQTAEQIADIKKGEKERAEPSSKAGKVDKKAVNGVSKFSLEGLPE
jgi:hypothetical protein